MPKATPVLTIIAGCNGCGKSTFSKSLSPLGTKSFDFDLEYSKIYPTIIDNELKDRMVYNSTWKLFENSIENSIKSQVDFTYETNFNNQVLHWPKHFKLNGFKVRLNFLYLDSIAEAKRRVQIRVENGGHFVSESEIETRYHDGFKNLNLHWDFFDEVLLFNSSQYNRSPKHIISFKKDEPIKPIKVPKFLKTKIPSLVTRIQ